jgi:dTDP-glucose 4,6-dehydratase
LNDPKVRQPDITKAKKVLGWKPKISRSDGLKKALQYFSERLSG